MSKSRAIVGGARWGLLASPVSIFLVRLIKRRRAAR